MDKMFVRVPVAIKAKVTEDLKLKIIGDVQNTIKTINLDIEHFEFQAKKALSPVSYTHLDVYKRQGKTAGYSGICCRSDRL